MNNYYYIESRKDIDKILKESNINENLVTIASRDSNFLEKTFNNLIEKGYEVIKDPSTYNFITNMWYQNFLIKKNIDL